MEIKNLKAHWKAWLKMKRLMNCQDLNRKEAEIAFV